MLTFIKWWFIILVLFVVGAAIFEPEILTENKKDKVDVSAPIKRIQQKWISIIKYDPKTIIKCQWQYSAWRCNAKAIYGTDRYLYFCIGHKDIMEKHNDVNYFIELPEV